MKEHINAFTAGFKVGGKVKVYEPYGSFTYEDVVQRITPKGRYVTVGDIRYTVSSDESAIHASCWGIGSIRPIK